MLDTLGLAGNVQTAQLLGLILQRDAKAALLLLHQLYSGGKDVGAVLGELSTLARDLLISSTAPEGGAALLSGGYDDKTLKSLQKAASNARLIQICTILQESAAALQNSVNRRTDAELCLLRLCDESLSGDLTALNARIERLENQLAAGAAYAAASAVPIQPGPVTEPEAPPFPDEEAPPPADAPEDDGPPPYGEPIAEAAPAASPEPAAAPEPAPTPEPAAQSALAAPAADDALIFARLMENYKNRLTPDKRAFIGMAKGRLSGGVLTVYCGSDVQKNMLDVPAVTQVLSEVTSQSVGQSVSVRFTVGTPEGDTHDKMQDLLQMGSKFGGFTVK